MRLAAVAITCLGACSAYHPGTLAPGPGGAVGAAGCVDVAITPRPELDAIGRVVEIAVGNGCDRAVEVDLGAVRAPGYAAFDPRGEIRPAVLDARTTAVEIIEFRPVAGLAPSTCFDVSAVAGTAVTPPTLCLGVL